MKKLLLTVMSALIMLTLSACVAKSTPNYKGKPAGAATVFVYIPNSVGTMDGISSFYYELFVNGKEVRGRMATGEHKRMYLNPGTAKISITRAHMSSTIVTLDLKADATYYIRATDTLDNGMTQFTQVDNETGKKEFSLTRCMVIPETNNIFSDFAK